MRKYIFGIVLVIVASSFTACQIYDLLGFGSMDLGIYWVAGDPFNTLGSTAAEEGTRIADGQTFDVGEIDLFNADPTEIREFLGGFYIANAANLAPEGDLVVTVTGEPVGVWPGDPTEFNGVLYWNDITYRTDDYSQPGYSEAVIPEGAYHLGRYGSRQLAIGIPSANSVIRPHGVNSAEVSVAVGTLQVANFTIQFTNTSTFGNYLVDVANVDPGSKVSYVLNYVEFTDYSGPEIQDLGLQTDTADADGESYLAISQRRDIYDTWEEGVPANTSILYVVADENTNDSIDPGEPVYLSSLAHMGDTHVRLDIDTWGERVTPGVTLSAAFPGHDSEVLKVYFVPVGVTAEQAVDEGVASFGASTGSFAFMGYYSGSFSGDTQSALLTVSTVVGTTLYDIIAYVDVNADNEIDAGEPYLALADVNIGATASIELDPSAFTAYSGATRPLPSF